jgi:glycosyltransferase involved in cell wall biosynthesis
VNISARRDFAVIVPAYNERENVAPLLAALTDAFTRHGLEGEVVLCDDGSTDGTYEAAVALAGEQGARLRVVRHGRNLGKTEAIQSAVRATGRRWVVVLDADLQYSPEELPRFLDALDEGWDLVTGRKIGLYEKRVVSRVYNWLSNRLFEVPVRDLNSMVACRAALLTEIPLRHDWHRFFVVLAHLRGYRVTEIPVTLHPRRAGEAKFSSPRRILTGLGDLVVVWFAWRVSAKPMHFFGGLALWLLGSGAIIALVTTLLRAASVPPPGIGYRPILGLVAVLVMSGLVLFVAGFIAELVAVLNAEVASLRTEVRNRPGHRLD